MQHWMEGERVEIGGSGRLLMALQLQRVAQLQMRIGHLRREGEGLAVRVLGRAQVPGILQGTAVLHPCRAVRRISIERFPVVWRLQRLARAETAGIPHSAHHVAR